MSDEPAILTERRERTLLATVNRQPMNAERAYELRMVNRLTEPGEAIAAPLELAGAIAANGPPALAATKRILTESVDWPDSEFFARQREI